MKGSDSGNIRSNGSNVGRGSSVGRASNVGTSNEPVEGEYRPARASDERSPCPALNALSNHGLIDRTGRAVEREQLLRVLETHLGIDRGFSGDLFDRALAMGLGDTARGTLSLAALCRHGAIEHDVSLVRHDFGVASHTTSSNNNTDDNKDNNNVTAADAHTVQPALVEQLLAMSTTGTTLTVADFGAFRRKRYAHCKKTNPNLVFGFTQQLLAYTESALIIHVFGEEFGAVPVKYIRAFLGEERLPIAEGWHRPRTLATLSSLSPIAFRIKWIAGFL
eukprot:jgi/Hompol1/4953/HPOL_004079-RA